jgi:hypothetical protein
MQGTIEKLTAVRVDDADIQKLHAAPGEFERIAVHIPPRLDAKTVVELLRAMGLIVPSSVSVAAAKGDLRESGHRFSIKVIDAALSEQGLSVADRIRFKHALNANRLLGD